MNSRQLIHGSRGDIALFIRRGRAGVRVQELTGLDSLEMGWDGTQWDEGEQEMQKIEESWGKKMYK